jgi:DNA-binding response OmpR family regulator
MSTAQIPISQPVALVIEDDEDTIDLLEFVLSQAGFAVVTADNGETGTELARVHQPALTTIDVSMPGMDGFETTRRIREFSGTYIVIISTRNAEQDILAGFDVGADDYVAKPVRPRELQARLAAVARRPVTTFAAQPIVSSWAPAAVDPARSAHHRQVVAGLESAPALLPAPEAPLPEPEEGEDGGRDGRDGMLELGMRFVGSWIEFYGLRINPARGLTVVDDRLIDLNPRQFDLLQLMLYSGTRTRSSRHLALRLRGETEETSRTQTYADRDWIESLMENLLNRLGERHLSPRWIESRPGSKFRLVRPEQTGTAAPGD